jgi:dTDP-4-dehydrorhamnose 3,5-epimerase-like enzyme
MLDSDAASPRRGSVPVFRDERGALTLAQLDLLPFTAARAYLLHDIPAGTRRGGHAHRRQHRFLVVVSGRAAVVLDDGRDVERFDLSPGESMHVAPLVWMELEALGDGLSVMVLASGL